MSLQYNQRAQLQLTPKYWLQKFVENVNHDHEGWIGPYEIDQSKKEKPVKEMNYEMNIKYYLRVRGYGQSFRMPQEFIKRGWRKTVFARPKGGDHDEWRLLVQDVPAKMRVDYPKDSIAVVLLSIGEVWTSEFLDFLSEKAHEASAQDMLQFGHPAPRTLESLLRSAKIAKVYIEALNLHRHPSELVSDRGLHNRGVLAKYMNAHPIYENYEVGDIVCFRRDFMGKTQWSQFPKVKFQVTRNRKIVKDFEVTHQLVAVKSCDITSAYFQARELDRVLLMYCGKRISQEKDSSIKIDVDDNTRKLSMIKIEAATVATLKEANKTVELALEGIGSKAYKDSKLCNVLFTLELPKSTGITANCFSPGLIPSPTFFRYQSQGFSSVFAFAAQNILKIAETPEFGGMALALMALDPSLDQRSGCFYSAIPPGKHLFVE
ncbi:unnamed protein product, partial [Effrenium voratum]